MALGRGIQFRRCSGRIDPALLELLAQSGAEPPPVCLADFNTFIAGLTYDAGGT